MKIIGICSIFALVSSQLQLRNRDQEQRISLTERLSAARNARRAANQESTENSNLIASSNIISFDPSNEVDRSPTFRQNPVQFQDTERNAFTTLRRPEGIMRSGGMFN